MKFIKAAGAVKEEVFVRLYRRGLYLTYGLRCLRRREPYGGELRTVGCGGYGGEMILTLCIRKGCFIRYELRRLK